MLIVGLAFFGVGILFTLRARAEVRDHNRRVYPSMKRGPHYLWHLVVFMLLGVACAAGAWLFEHFT